MIAQVDEDFCKRLDLIQSSLHVDMVTEHRLALSRMNQAYS